MSRIRSVHPGLWTDERFVLLTFPARLLFVGLWNECDDQGSFEWSPVKLKMRLMAADALDVVPLLDELTTAGCVLRYEHSGRHYGAVRNWHRYQRPKKPNSTYPQTDGVRHFTALHARSTRSGSEPVEDEFPTGGEPGGNRSRNLPPDGGGRKKEEGSLPGVTPSRGSLPRAHTRERTHEGAREVAGGGRP